MIFFLINLIMMLIPTTTRKTYLFSSILMAIFYSQYSHNLIINKMIINNDLHIIINKIIKNYYYKTSKAERFYKIISPEILLLKFLKYTNPNNYKNFEINITYISDIYNIINIPFLELFNFNNQFGFKEIPNKIPYIIIIYNIFENNLKPLSNYDFNYKNKLFDISLNSININGINYQLDSIIHKNYETHITFNKSLYNYSHNIDNNDNDNDKLALIFVMMII